MSNRLAREPALYGRRAIGATAMTAVISGFPAPGWRLPRSGCSGRLDIGVGATERTSGTVDIGVRKWASTAALITASATSAQDMRADIGPAGTSSITAA